MRKERDLQSVTENYADLDHGPHSAVVTRILREQSRRLGANIAILEQRYEPLPSGSRVGTLQTVHPPLRLVCDPSVEPAERGWLRGLIGQHERLIKSAENLVTDGSDGQRGALILKEVVQNHEEMTWMLTALLRDGLATCDIMPIPVDAAGVRITPAALPS